MQVTRGGGEEAFESPDGKYLYWGKFGKSGIWRMPAGGGEEIQILSVSGENRFAVAKPGIWFVDIGSSGSARLSFLEEATLRATPFHEFSKGLEIDTFSTGLSVSPDRRWILYTQLELAGSNLMLVENIM